MDKLNLKRFKLNSEKEQTISKIRI